MSDVYFEPLSPTDYTFLVSETPSLHMHVTGLMILDSSPLKRRGGGIDFGAIKQAYADVLHLIPRYRQKLMWQSRRSRSSYLSWLSVEQPDESRPPVWVDDPHFNIDYHVRHTALPRPGNDDQLKRLVARVAGQPLDRNRPLWEIWVIEGLRGNRFGVISKMHHCMVDGKSGVDLGTIIMSDKPDYQPEAPPPYHPRPAPSQAQLRSAARRKQLQAPVKVVEGVTELWRDSDSFTEEVLNRARGVAETFGANMGKSRSDTPLNGENGPHRVVEWLDTPLEYIKSIRKAMDCTVNDVVLTVVTGAFRELLTDLGFDVENEPFRIAAPVSIWGQRQKGEVGNEIMSWTIDLPVDHADPHEQLAAIRAITGELKNSRQALGVKMLTSFMEYTPGLISLAARNATGPINSFVTNVPGPQFPLYQLGAQLLRSYPVVPLLNAMGVGIGLMSYNGVCCWGVTSDLDVVDEATLGHFVRSLDESIERTGRAAGLGRPGRA